MHARASILLPILIILLGGAWLLNAIDLMPGVNWVWTLALAGIGVAMMATGINRLSIVIGPWLMAAGILSVLRQTGRVRLEIEIPILVILLGLLMLVSRFSTLPWPPAFEAPKRG
jgi:hypothetical protein